MEKRRTVHINEANKPLVEKIYSIFLGRALLKLIIRPWVSKFVGFFLDKKISNCFIPSFIKNNKIDITQFVSREYNSFNDFFTREKLDIEKQIYAETGDFISPCDAGLSVYNIDETSTFKIKNVSYSVSSLLENDKLAQEYIGGLCLVFRLSVDDYHRYCYVDDGYKDENIHIKGILHTVQPVAVIGEKAFVKNTREYTVLHTDNFGKVVHVEVGALLVGRIKNHHDAQRIFKGQEKGMFEYGGSTIVLLVKKNILNLDNEFYENTNNNLETKVKYGEVIGRSF